MPERDPSISLADVPDEQWPFPFPRSDWEQILASAQGFILSLVKRIEVLKAKLAENSQNTSRPPSTDSPYRKPRTKTNPAKKKRGARKGHKGARQVLVEPTKVVDVPPGPCGCGGAEVVGSESYHTHQHIELPEIPPSISLTSATQPYPVTCQKRSPLKKSG